MSDKPSPPNKAPKCRTRRGVGTTTTLRRYDDELPPHIFPETEVRSETYDDEQLPNYRYDNLRPD